MGEPAGEWVTRLPAERLRPYVDRYVGYRMVGDSPGVHRGLPSRHLTFIVDLGPGIDVIAQSDPAQSPQTYQGVVGGLQTAPALIAYGEIQEGIAIELTPLGSRAILGLPAAEISHTSVELSDLVGGAGSELVTRLRESSSWSTRFAICDQMLSRSLRPDDIASPLRPVWRALVAAQGNVSIDEIAQRTGWTRQHLTRQFRTEFGLSPKAAARVIRFERAQRMLRGTPSFVSIAQVAAVCGYYDQAHLNRDFVALAGCTPRELLRTELPFVQDEEGLGTRP